MSLSVTSLPAQEVVVRPLTGALGCEISGVDLAHLSDAAFASIYQAFLDYSAVMFHDQVLTQEQFAAFGRRFAKLEDEPFLPHRADVPGVFYLRGAPRDAKSLSTQNLGWHADHTYQKNPSLGAMLYARDVPAAGGDTLFASNYLSYEALSPAMQAFLEDKIAIHDVLQYGLKSGHYSTGTPKAIEGLLKMRQSSCYLGCFNEAGARSPGRRDVFCAVALKVSVLQWSRGTKPRKTSLAPERTYVRW